MTSTASSDPRWIELASAADKVAANANLTYTPTHSLTVADTDSINISNGTSPVLTSPQPLRLAADSQAYSSLSTQPTHLSSRRTFAGGILRYYTSPETVIVSGSTSTIRSPLKLARTLWSSCKRKEWWVNASPFQLHLFADIAIWKAALIEMLGTLLLTFIVLVTVTGILNHKQDYSYFPTAIAICHIPIIAFMIFATATATGGHLNPMISFATCLAGLTEFPRMVLYMSAQVVGAIIASYLVKHLTPSSLLLTNQLAMCSIGVDQSVAQALTLEIVADVFVLYVAFGVALDDRQRQAMPSWLPPFIISTTIALLIYTTSTLSGMGNGAIAFPTRCFGPAVAMGLVTADSFQIGTVTVVNAQWIYWVGPFVSSCIIAFFYRLVPPGYTVLIKAERAQRQQLQEQQQQHGMQQAAMATSPPWQQQV